MEESKRTKYEARHQELRAHLKRFEGDWAKQNGGKKPGREAIKQNPVIERKYKEYNQVSKILDGKIPPPQENMKSRKRKSEEAISRTPSRTPSKRSNPAETPLNPQRHNTDLLDGFETPAIRKLFSPAVPTSIGPTPQKDGHVLGLFDLLVEDVVNTPSKGRLEEPSSAENNIQATPNKRKHGEIEQDSPMRLERTPMSSSKRAMLASFMTPLKNRDGNLQDAKTPSSVSKLLFSTPAFLRRAPLPTMDENGHYVSPAPLRLPRKPLVRGLSSVVASLRKMEEKKLDDDLEALHDMENDDGLAPPTKSAKEKDDVLFPDSQGQQLLSGFDDEGQYDSEPDAQVGRDGQPLRVYKKKGQKRTTRKVNMRPTQFKRPEDSTNEPDDEEEDEIIPETQYDATKVVEEPQVDLNSGSDFEASEEGDEDAAKKGKKAKKAPKTKMKERGKEPEKEGKIKKTVKKISATANQNFKRLKLKNHGAKGGPGIGSRFRRRR